MIIINEPIKFEWDKNNQNKNSKKHKVSITEAEEVFFDKNKKIAKDIFHSQSEKRYLLLGKTKKNRKLYLVFTLRKNKVRVISARDLNRKEYKLLER